MTLVGGLTAFMTAFTNIYIIYGLLIIYMGAITFGISVASAQIAKRYLFLFSFFVYWNIILIIL